MQKKTRTREREEKKTKKNIPVLIDVQGKKQDTVPSNDISLS
jgi:hypothetical protein